MSRPMPENKRSKTSPRAVLVDLVNTLAAAGKLSGESQVSTDMALATVTTSDGKRYNISLHRIQDEAMEPTRQSRPKVRVGR